MKPSNSPSPRARRHAAVQLWLANIGIAMIVGSNYLAHVPHDEHPRLWLFALPALVSSILTLTLVPGLLFVLAAHLFRQVRVLAYAQAVLWTVFQVLLYADTRIFNIFRYHFNGQVWNLVYTRGSEDAIHLGWQVWTAVSLGLACVGGIELFIWRWSLARSEHHTSASKRLLRPAMVFGSVLLPAVLIEKSIYAQADLSRDRQVTALARLFPLYARVPMEDLASKVLGVDSEKPRPPHIVLDGIELDYPLEDPFIPADGPRPNVVVIVIDCLREDMIGPESTPAIDAWAKDSLVFENHVSGGNSTRYGLFSLLYGLHGSYWFPVLQEQRSPVLIDVLDELGYEFGVFSSASMNYPELRDTAWSRIEDDVHDDFGATQPWVRDGLAKDALISWLDEREDDAAPFFSFILLDSPHQTYSHPPQKTPFAPSAEEVNYLAMTGNEGPEPGELERVRNRYKNAVRHADDVAGEILERLEAGGFLESTLVFVTGDHGEEFLECGFFGHTSAFTPEQVRVPFVVRGPGIEPGTSDGSTSHLDFAPTLLEILGADPAMRSKWTLGGSFFEPEPQRRRVISGWNELGMWTPAGIVRVPLSPFEFDLEVYDYRWRLVMDDADILQEEADQLLRLGAECHRFLR